MDYVLCRKLSNDNVEVASSSVVRAPCNATRRELKLQRVDYVLCRKLSNDNVEVASSSVVRAPCNATTKRGMLPSPNDVDNGLRRRLSNDDVEVVSASVVRAPSNATTKTNYMAEWQQSGHCAGQDVSATTMLKLRALQLCVLQATQQRR